MTVFITLTATYETSSKHSEANATHMKTLISIVILTNNSERKLPDCLKSVADWADDIVILDDMSTDSTLDIVSQYTNRIYKRQLDIEGIHRNYAYSLAKHDYILSLDSDERVTPELAREIQELIQKGPTFTGYDIPHRNFLGTYWIQHGGWYPNATTRLFKKSEFRYAEEEYHPRSLLPGPRGRLKGEIIHLAIDNFTNMIGKLNHQTNFEARKWFREKRKVGVFTLSRKMLHRFFKAYFLQQGFRDGWIGFMLAVNGSLYQLLSYAKYWELKEREKGAL